MNYNNLFLIDILKQLEFIIDKEVTIDVKPLWQLIKKRKIFK